MIFANFVQFTSNCWVKSHTIKCFSVKKSFAAISWLSTKKHNKRRKHMTLKLPNSSMGELTLWWIQHRIIKSIFFPHKKKFATQILYQDLWFLNLVLQYTHTAHILLQAVRDGMKCKGKMFTTIHQHRYKKLIL